MYKKVVDGIVIDVYSKEISLANTLKVEAGTTGFCGGDSGHGGRTYFALEDLGGTDMGFKVSPNRIEVYLGGDCELCTVADALNFITDIFKNEIFNKEDKNND